MWGVCACGGFFTNCTEQMHNLRMERERGEHARKVALYELTSLPAGRAVYECTVDGGVFFKTTLASAIGRVKEWDSDEAAVEGRGGGGGGAME